MSETEFKYLSKKGASNFKRAQSDAKVRSSVKKNLQTAMDVASAPGRFAASMAGATKNKDDKKSPGALRRLATMKAKSKKNKTSKTGRMLDRMEMRDAPRTPFLTKNKKGKPAPKKKSIIPKSPTN